MNLNGFFKSLTPFEAFFRQLSNGMSRNFWNAELSYDEFEITRRMVHHESRYFIQNKKEFQDLSH